MRKETILAILAGITIGIIFAFGSWRVVKSIKKDTSLPSAQPTPFQKKNLILTLDKFKDFDVITAEKIVFSGLTNSNSNVLVITSEKDFLTKSKEDGTFETEVELPAGLSQVKLISFDNLGKIDEIKINLVFSTEFKEENGTAYVGTVTDISGETIQIKDTQGEIKQASLEVKATDLAIGDYVVAMGIVNGNKVLKTKRILITSPMEENKYEAKLITIENLSKTKINDIILPKKWNGPDVKNLEIGQNIILVGLQNEDKFDIRSIFISTL